MSACPYDGRARKRNAVPLRGALSEFTLEDILRLLQATGKSGSLEVRGPRSRGALELTAGQLSAARSGDDSGAIALGAVLAIGVGDFVFRSGDTGTPNLEGPLDELLARGRAEAQRIAATRALIRDGAARFALSERAIVRDAFSVTGEQWRVLLAVDGRRDVNEIALAARGGRLATLLTLGELVQQGLVDAVEVPAEAAAEPASAPVEVGRQPSRQAGRSVPREALPPADAPSVTPPAPPPSALSGEPSLSGEGSWSEPLFPGEGPPLEAPQAASGESAPAWMIAASATEVSPEVDSTPLPAAVVTDARLAALADISRIAEPSSGDGPASWVGREPETTDGARAEPSPRPDPVSPVAGPPIEVDADALGVVGTKGPLAPASRVTAGNEEEPPPVEGAPRPVGPQGLRAMLTALTRAVARPREPQAQAGVTSAPPAPAATPTPLPTPADLARLANALIAEYSSGRYGVWPHEDIAARLRRVYQLNPVGMPLPLRGEELDVRALESPHLEAGLALPYVAMLIRQLREDGARCFGGENADRGFRAALLGLRGWDEALASAPEEILARSRAPTHGRITLLTGGERRTWVLARREYVIGRASVGCDVRLEGETVADHHAHISPYLDGFQLRDLGSASGTSVDGTSLAALVGEHFLSGGETIRIGEVSLLYERLPDDDAANDRPG